MLCTQVTSSAFQAGIQEISYSIKQHDLVWRIKRLGLWNGIHRKDLGTAQSRSALGTQPKVSL